MDQLDYEMELAEDQGLVDWMTAITEMLADMAREHGPDFETSAWAEMREGWPAEAVYRESMVEAKRWGMGADPNFGLEHWIEWCGDHNRPLRFAEPHMIRSDEAVCQVCGEPLTEDVISRQVGLGDMHPEMCDFCAF